MRRRPVVYLSGPITLGDRTHNFQQAAEVQRTLMEVGYSVINPMLTMSLEYAWEVPHRAWIENDLAIIRRCDVVLRLPGESRGADMETAFAGTHGIPVVRSMGELQEVLPL